jgi:hypothetical protein
VAALSVALFLSLLGAACGGADQDADRADEERRTCASLRERVTARALDDAGLLAGGSTTDASGDKEDDLGPAAFARDPAAWYAALEAALAAAPFGPRDEPSAASPARRLVETCQNLET